MSIPEVDPSQSLEAQSLEALAEAQLQQELRSLFAVDTQNYLQRYSQIAQQLGPSSWTSDIQELYRCIHTIKGGAVTVSAIAVLQVATALEDVLSDLRYLNAAPPLVDGYLSQTLLEVGELLTGILEGQETLSDAQLAPILNRVQVLHDRVRERYLPSWSEQKQLHQEFAEQGFDLVVLELEIALERSPAQGPVAEAMLQIAQQTLAQLRQIGQDLQFAPGWSHMLNQAQELIAQPDSGRWQSQWPRLFQALKRSAQQGGTPVSFSWDRDSEEQQAAPDSPVQEQALQPLADLSLLPDGEASRPNSLSQPDLNQINAFLEGLDPLAALTGAATPDWTRAATEPSELTQIEEFLEILPLPPEYAEESPTADGLPLEAAIADFESEFTPLHPASDLTAGVAMAPFLEAFEPLTGVEVGPETLEAELPDFSQGQEWLEQIQRVDRLPEFLDQPQEPSPAIDPLQTAEPIAARVTPRDGEVSEKVQIPVPLEKLDQSAQHLVETLLAARMAQGLHQTLQNQITQLVTLAQESAQYITSLRQIQDDYALLDNLRRTAPGPIPERYRQGYTTINRLLETSLRLSELGAEAEKTVQQTAESLQNLDGTLSKLQNTVEDSRLIPFQNLSFRAKAILRDLITRYGKPARLVVQGEQIELDVSTVRNLEPALLHLLRNAYDHGLETPAERVAQGKPEQGTISISLQRRSNLFQLCLQDDGRGIEASLIQARAESLKLPRTSTQTPAELLAVICQPGFSSRTEVSELSGRGVGMDVVAAQVSRLGGRLSLDTSVGQGTSFLVQFPVPHLLVTCILLQAGSRTFALPTEDIKTTALFETLNAVPLQGSAQLGAWQIQTEAEPTPVLDLLNYWQPRPTPRSLPETAVCVHVVPEAASQGVWLLADELLGQADLLINPLPAPLIAPAGLIGVSLQVNGTLVPVLDARALAQQLLLPTGEASPPSASDSLPPDLQEIDTTTQAIVIVDDAALIRRRIEASLTAYGYTTHTCADGLEAWNWLQKHPRATLLITDIEMPNMDGFTLIDRCRQAGFTVPVLVISSRLSEEWFSEAKRLGATDYLTKGFSTVELLNKVNSLLGAA